MVCQGNSTQLCGGPNALNVFNFTGTITGPPTVNPPAGGGGGGNNGAPVFPVDSGLPTTWEYSGCYVYVAFTDISTGTLLINFFWCSDNMNGRVLATEKPDDDTLTVETCVNFCNDQNFTLAGMEFGVQCCKLDSPHGNFWVTTY